MSSKKNDIVEAFKTIDSDYYIIELDIDNTKYLPVLEEINKHVQLYINNPNNIVNLKDTSTLNLLLKYLYNRVVSKLKLKDSKEHKYNNIELLDILWNIYSKLCYKLLLKPTILKYCLFTGIDNATISDWVKGNNSNILYCQTAKKWKQECESVLYDEAVSSGNIGCIFALKANYGYRDNYVINVQEEPKEVKTIEQIEQDYNNILLDNTNNIIDF